MFLNALHSSLTLLQLLTVLLMASADRRAADLPKAVVKLEPPWIHVLQGDTVTLQCQGAHAPGDTSTQWFYNGSSIPSQDQPHYRFKAQSNDSGEFRCQMGQTSLSDPVHLEVFSGEWRKGLRVWEDQGRSTDRAGGAGGGGGLLGGPAKPSMVLLTSPMKM
ncbi:low affinity immunoglobulin gamma Fc region receptor II-a-like [Tupaia chinensis]|uniref:low affinity immunoglobulin gamma Fc region receptor II-a-like n=1 Tax=Tupaia chinensis TaxID=246437 RepID=UPI000FFBBBD4|nr:low affinity immunoglobulin gamma Fc region receptor II-a-like [Tupaia chinensis]